MIEEMFFRCLPINRKSIILPQLSFLFSLNFVKTIYCKPNFGVHLWWNVTRVRSIMRTWLERIFSYFTVFIVLNQNVNLANLILKHHPIHTLKSTWIKLITIGREGSFLIMFCIPNFATNRGRTDVLNLFLEYLLQISYCTLIRERLSRLLTRYSHLVTNLMQLACTVP